MKLDEARALGLGYAFDANPNPSQGTAGPIPDMGGGVFLCRSTDRIGYLPERQTWCPLVGNVGVWVGMWNDSPPTPESLQRDKMVSGEWLPLADGNPWLIPKAREYFEHEGELLMRHTLPLTYGVNDEGELVQNRVKASFQSLWDAATSYLDAQLEAEQSGQSNWTHASNVAIVAEAFKANYYVSTSELALLGVWDDEMRNAVRDIVVDMERIMEFSKKKQEAEAAIAPASSSHSSDGHGQPSTDNQTPTVQPSPTGAPSAGNSIISQVEGVLNG